MEELHKETKGMSEHVTTLLEFPSSVSKETIEEVPVFNLLILQRLQNKLEAYDTLYKS